MLTQLRPGGLFFIGTAEGRVPCKTPLKPLAPGAFRKVAVRRHVMPRSSSPHRAVAACTRCTRATWPARERGDRMETLLGSCVAIVLTDPRRTVGAMCHVVHARPAPQAGSQPRRLADAALAPMYALLRARGITPRLCEAYVYGGGNMFPGAGRQTARGRGNAAGCWSAGRRWHPHADCATSGAATAYRRLQLDRRAERPERRGRDLKDAGP